MPSRKFITLVGISANFSHALRVVSWSLPRSSGCFFKNSSLWRRMKGKSSAHQARPMTGTQMSCCLMKNLSNGMRRLNKCCNTRMSTHDWWLLLTKYQLCGSRPSTPCTSQVVRWVRPIQPLLHDIHDSAMKSSIGSMARRTVRNGKTNLTEAKTSRMGTHNSAFNVISKPAIRPTSAEGRKFNMGEPALL